MGIVRTLIVPCPSPRDLFKTELDPVHCGRVRLPENRGNIQYPQMHGTVLRTIARVSYRVYLLFTIKRIQRLHKLSACALSILQ